MSLGHQARLFGSHSEGRGSYGSSGPCTASISLTPISQRSHHESNKHQGSKLRGLAPRFPSRRESSLARFAVPAVPARSAGRETAARSRERTSKGEPPQPDVYKERRPAHEDLLSLPFDVGESGRKAKQARKKPAGRASSPRSCERNKRAVPCRRRRLLCRIDRLGSLKQTLTDQCNAIRLWYVPMYMLVNREWSFS